MIKDIDKSEVISAHLVQSPVLGAIPVKDISGGVKTLILMAFDKSGKIFNASACGDNCAKWIAKLGRKKDLILPHIHEQIIFLDEENQTGCVVCNRRSLLEKLRFRRECHESSEIH